MKHSNDIGSFIRWMITMLFLVMVSNQCFRIERLLEKLQKQQEVQPQEVQIVTEEVQ